MRRQLEEVLQVGLLGGFTTGGRHYCWGKELATSKGNFMTGGMRLGTLHKAGMGLTWGKMLPRMWYDCKVVASIVPRKDGLLPKSQPSPQCRWSSQAILVPLQSSHSAGFAALVTG
jgi:hypothetical protein